MLGSLSIYVAAGARSALAFQTLVVVIANFDMYACELYFVDPQVPSLSYLGDGYCDRDDDYNTCVNFHRTFAKRPARCAVS